MIGVEIVTRTLRSMSVGAVTCLVGAGIVASVLVSSRVSAQVYTCIAPDGTRIYSDRKCGPDAKLVPGMHGATKTRNSAKRSAAKDGVAPKSVAELDDLLRLCNGGHQPSCMAWSKGGGPNRLRAKEQERERKCAAGSLADCEERYCRDGVSDECRRRVLQTAAMSGRTWYLRGSGTPGANGITTHSIRCLREGSRDIRDASIDCAATAGPQRCKIAQAQGGFASLDQAAAEYCSASR